MQIRLESAAQPDVIALIDALDAYQKPLYPLESFHGVDIEALCRPNALFAVARDPQGHALGCCAMVLEADYAELKRLYVSPLSRRQGIGLALIDFLERIAAGHGRRRYRLETGVLQPEALALYARAGYVPCAPFGDYVEDPHSLFYAKDTD